MRCQQTPVASVACLLRYPLVSMVVVVVLVVVVVGGKLPRPSYTSIPCCVGSLQDGAIVKRQT